jgi:hypothetical protein
MTLVGRFRFWSCRLDFSPYAGGLECSDAYQGLTTDGRLVAR